MSSPFPGTILGGLPSMMYAQATQVKPLLTERDRVIATNACEYNYEQCKLNARVYYMDDRGRPTGEWGYSQPVLKECIKQHEACLKAVKDAGPYAPDPIPNAKECREKLVKCLSTMPSSLTPTGVANYISNCVADWQECVRPKTTTGEMNRRRLGQPQADNATWY